MSVDIEYRKLAQILLNEKGVDLFVDGIIGKKSNDAFRSFYTGSDPNSVAAYVVQHHTITTPSRLDDIHVDGYWGPNTEDAADRIISVRAGGSLNYLDRIDEKEEKDTALPDITCWSPKTRRLIKEYGQPGTNQGMCNLPHGITLKLDWDLDKTVTRFTCHESLVNDFAKGYERVMDYYSEEEFIKLGLNRFGGVYNKRKKRGGSSWSTHSWGIAKDTYPSKNRLRWDKHRAAFARDQYTEWFNIWQRFGFLSLGRCYNFDWMHIQKNP